MSSLDAQVVALVRIYWFVYEHRLHFPRDEPNLAEAPRGIHPAEKGWLHYVEELKDDTIVTVPHRSDVDSAILAAAAFYAPDFWIVSCDQFRDHACELRSFGYHRAIQWIVSSACLYEGQAPLCVGSAPGSPEYGSFM